MGRPKACATASAVMSSCVGPMPPVGDLSASEAVECVGRDKKIVRGTLHFVLPVDIGRVEIVNDVAERELVAAMKAIGLRR